MANIFNQIENYLIFQKEIYGNNIFLENSIENIAGVDSSLNQAIPNGIEPAGYKIVSAIESSKSTQYEKVAEPDVQISDKLSVSNIKKEDIMSVKINWRDSLSLQELYDSICNCKECPLGKSRNKFVFGAGSFNADILVIGEGPGAEEDQQGLPFVGRSGQLLTKILNSIDLQREEVFIANIVKCRPPNNRRPEANEVEICEQYLKKQIDLLKPKFILALGLTAIDTLLKSKHKMGEIRGKIMSYHGIPTLATYHPAALLRNPNFKKDTWEDVKLLKSLYIQYLENNK